MTDIIIRGGVINTHGHPRNPRDDGDGRSELIIPQYQPVFNHLIAIGNTIEPLTTVERALDMQNRWQSLSPKTRIHVAGLLTEKTSPKEIIKGYDQPSNLEAWVAMKMFLKAVSNSGGHDVDNIKAIMPCVKAMTYTKWRYKKKPMVLKIHCERKWTPLGRRIPIDEREKIAVHRDIEYILSEVPDAHIEICHVSDGDTIMAIREYRRMGYNVTGEISPHYTEYSNDDLFEGPGGGTAINSHCFCLPKFKSEKDKQIIHDAMLSGEDCWHYGDDGACHNHLPTREKMVKINKAGMVVGGQTQIPEATISYVAELFVDAGREKHLQNFLFTNAQNLYGLHGGDNNMVLTLKEDPWVVPHVLEHDFGDEVLHCIVAMGGQERRYRATLR